MVVKDISEALVQSGFPASAINVDGIPAEWSILQGTSSLKDSFRTVLRMAKPCKDPIKCDEYLAITNRNLLVVVLKPKTSLPHVPFQQPIPTPHATGVSETDIIGTNALPDVLAAVVRHYGAPTEVIVGIHKTFNTTKCIHNGGYCWGDNYDTAYIDFAESFLIKDADDFAVVCGGNHQRLDYAVYTSVGLFSPSGLAIGLIDDAVKDGSASCYAPRQTNVDKLYCVEIRAKGNCPRTTPCVELLFDGPNELFLQARVNLNPVTKTGPDVDELIMPKVYVYEDNKISPVRC